ncbi:unnamed protein product [Rhizoctonia solani]|uniref:Protein kinase domain-containing protein n=1 Tax=Rhizoctonia solani TaxID=456999 RepID=A0A8H3CRV6_9AGAM|nr:unnamed protein product [Rhizoctonia solani]
MTAMSTESDTRRHIISGGMAHAEAADILRQHDCPEFTEEWAFVNPNRAPSAGGGWGDVFQGRTKSGRIIAVKRTRLYTEDKQFPRILKESINELHIWSKCDHPNILRLLGFTELDGQFAMVSPWIEGGDVRAYIQRYPFAANRLDIFNYQESIDNFLKHGTKFEEHILDGP